jgi:hypothetical protein
MMSNEIQILAINSDENGTNLRGVTTSPVTGSGKEADEALDVDGGLPRPSSSYAVMSRRLAFDTIYYTVGV